MQQNSFSLNPHFGIRVMYTDVYLNVYMHRLNNFNSVLLMYHVVPEVLFSIKHDVCILHTATFGRSTNGRLHRDLFAAVSLIKFDYVQFNVIILNKCFLVNLSLKFN